MAGESSRHTLYFFGGLMTIVMRLCAFSFCALVMAASAFRPPQLHSSLPGVSNSRRRTLAGQCRSPVRLRLHVKTQRSLASRPLSAGALRCSTAREWDAATVEERIAEDMSFYAKITTVEDALLREATTSALDTLAQALRLYGPERTVVSFNGGKPNLLYLPFVVSML